MSRFRKHMHSLRSLGKVFDEELSTMITDEESLIALGIKLEMPDEEDELSCSDSDDE